MRLIDIPQFKPHKLPESDLWREIQARVNAIFTEIPDDLPGAKDPQGMLRESYVHRRITPEHLLSYYEEGSSCPPEIVAPLRPDPTRRLVAGAADAGDEPFFFADRPYPLPRLVLLVGDIGVGKTTYLWYQRTVTLAERGAFCAEVNVGRPLTKRDLAKRVREGFEVQVLEKFVALIKGGVSSDAIEFSIYEDVLQRSKDELSELPEGSLAWKRRCRSKIREFKRGHAEEVLRREIACISKITKQPVFLFIDEVDRISDPALRTDLVDIARDISIHAGVTVVIATRIYTQSFILERTIAGTSYLILTLQPPHLGDIIKKRLLYVQKLIKADPSLRVLLKDRSVHFKDSTSGITLTTDDILDFVTACCESLLKKGTLTCIERLSNYNVRLALVFIKAVLSSPHLHMNVLRLASGLSLPQHELLPILALGNWDRYNPAESLIVNFFDDDKPNGVYNTLIRIRVLQTVVCLARKDKTDVKPARIVSTLGRFGYDTDHCSQVLRSLVTIQFLDTDDRTAAERDLHEVGDLRLTLAGAYYLNDLIFEIRYAELMQDAVDWPQNLPAAITQALAASLGPNATTVDPERLILPRPVSPKEPHTATQKRLFALLQRMQLEEACEEARVRSLPLADQQLYRDIVSDRLSRELSREYERTIKRIELGSVRLEGQWNFVHEPSQECSQDLRTGLMMITRDAEGKLGARLDTARTLAFAAVERTSRRITLWLDAPRLRFLLEMHPSGDKLSGFCECNICPRGLKKCEFHATRINPEHPST
jgi:ABC-type branched-subunit amino acid transport system ATPase component